MENTQHTKTEKGKETVTSDDLAKSKLVAESEKQGSTSSSEPTTATTQNAIQKTWTSAELLELQRKIGLVAGAISDFQTAGGLVAVKNVHYDADKCVVKIYLTASGINISAVNGVDGIDLVAEVQK